MNKTYCAVNSTERELEIAVARAVKNIATRSAIDAAIAEARANAINRRLGIVRRGAK